MTTPNSINWNDLLGIAGEATGVWIGPIGEYHVVVDKATAKKTQNGKDQISASFRVASGPHQGKGPIYNNFTISPESPNAMSFFFQHLGVFGISADYLKNNHPTIAQLASMMVGKQCMVSIEHGVWQGKTKMDCKKINPVAGNPNGVPSGPPSMPVPPKPVPASTSNGDAPAIPSVPATPEQPATATPPPPAPF